MKPKLKSDFMKRYANKRTLSLSVVALLLGCSSCAKSSNSRDSHAGSERPKEGNDLVGVKSHKSLAILGERTATYVPDESSQGILDKPEIAPTDLPSPPIDYCDAKAVPDQAPLPRSVCASIAEITRKFVQLLGRQPTREESQKYQRIRWIHLGDAIEDDFPRDSLRNRIKNLYKECLNRKPPQPIWTESEVDAWEKTGRDLNWIRDQICRSTEGLSEVVRSIYRQCLKREATPEEVSGWLAVTRDENNLYAGICKAPEAVARELVRRFFERCLKRKPAEPQEIDAWLARTGGDREILEQGICNSEEALITKIKTLYNDCLHRQASETEIADWLSKTRDVSELLFGICRSEESISELLVGESTMCGIGTNYLSPNQPGEMPYDFWQNNCHTAANNAVLSAPDKTGIAICHGWKEAPSRPNGHTFVYQLLNGNTTYTDGGQPCACPGLPPVHFEVLGTDCHSVCARRLCYGQLTSDSTVLNIGQLIESPGVRQCAIKTFKDGATVDSCLGCCDNEADVQWKGENPLELAGSREKYRRACKSQCRSNDHVQASLADKYCSNWAINTANGNRRIEDGITTCSLVRNGGVNFATLTCSKYFATKTWQPLSEKPNEDLCVGNCTAWLVTCCADGVKPDNCNGVPPYVAPTPTATPSPT